MYDSSGVKRMSWRCFDWNLGEGIAVQRQSLLNKACQKESILKIKNIGHFKRKYKVYEESNMEYASHSGYQISVRVRLRQHISLGLINEKGSGILLSWKSLTVKKKINSICRFYPAEYVHAKLAQSNMSCLTLNFHCVETCIQRPPGF